MTLTSPQFPSPKQYCSGPATGIPLFHVKLCLWNLGSSGKLSTLDWSSTTRWHQQTICPTFWNSHV